MNKMGNKDLTRDLTRPWPEGLANVDDDGSGIGHAMVSDHEHDIFLLNDLVLHSNAYVSH